MSFGGPALQPLPTASQVAADGSRPEELPVPPPAKAEDNENPRVTGVEAEQHPMPSNALLAKGTQLIALGRSSPVATINVRLEPEPVPRRELTTTSISRGIGQGKIYHTNDGPPSVNASIIRPAVDESATSIHGTSSDYKKSSANTSQTKRTLLFPLRQSGKKPKYSWVNRSLLEEGQKAADAALHSLINNSSLTNDETGTTNTLSQGRPHSAALLQFSRASSAGPLTTAKRRPLLRSALLQARPVAILESDSIDSQWAERKRMLAMEQARPACIDGDLEEELSKIGTDTKDNHRRLAVYRAALERYIDTQDSVTQVLLRKIAKALESDESNYYKRLHDAAYQDARRLESHITALEQERGELMRYIASQQLQLQNLLRIAKQRAELLAEIATTNNLHVPRDAVRLDLDPAAIQMPRLRVRTLAEIRRTQRRLEAELGDQVDPGDNSYTTQDSISVHPKSAAASHEAQGVSIIPALIANSDDHSGANRQIGLPLYNNEAEPPPRHAVLCKSTASLYLAAQAEPDGVALH